MCSPPPSTSLPRWLPHSDRGHSSSGTKFGHWRPSVTLFGHPVAVLERECPNLARGERHCPNLRGGGPQPSRHTILVGVYRCHGPLLHSCHPRISLRVSKEQREELVQRQQGPLS